MSNNNWKFTAGNFEGFSPERLKKSYEIWIIIKEMGYELLMTFWPDGHVTYGTPGIHADTETEEAVVGEAMREWKRRNSSISSTNVKHIRR